jgi:hypothetical protein
MLSSRHQKTSGPGKGVRMRKVLEYAIYIAGVIFFSWNYYRLKGAFDTLPFVIFSVFYLFGVSKFATLLSAKVGALIGQEAESKKS